ncbi:MAG: tetratricopeptide repeat protein [Haliscomenobacteraceae bacterium CHB4]|nr:hypothetical protein [Saprospiraceae bacterium]MCE7922786.1 tetratricopeptide repeat protein [Haliscomenobacteraceae bacterium CHB4]
MVKKPSRCHFCRLVPVYFHGNLQISVKKQIFLLLFAIGTGACDGIAQPAIVFNNLVQQIRQHPADTAAWSALQTWFDTTALPPRELSTALEHTLRAIPLETDGRLRAELLRQSGISYMDAGDFQQSSERLMEAIRLFEALSDARGTANVQVNLGALNYHLSQLEESIRFWRQAALFFERNGPAARLGLVYSNIGSAFSELEQLDSAETYHRRALRIHEQNKDTEGMSKAWNNLGVTFEYRERYSEALACYRKARALCDSLHDLTGSIRAMLNEATILEYQQKYSEALDANLRALAMMPQCREKALYRFIYLNLAGVYSKMNRYKEAFVSLGNYHTYKDSLVNEDNTRYIQSLQAQYESEKKEKEIALLSRASETQSLRLQQQRLLTTGLLVISLLLIALVWMAVRNQRRTDRLLLNILPVAVASELRRTGSVQPKRHENVTVLFADLVGFTEFGHALPPETLVGLIDRYYRAFDAIIARNRIEKIKTIGDSYMCAGGLPEPDPQHARRVFQAATDMLRWVRESAAISEDLPHLQIRIGIHSGPVVAGVVGKSKYAYDIWGDTVNTAARMEQFGIQDRINLSEETRQLLGDDANATPREPVEVKGIGRVKMYLAG